MERAEAALSEVELAKAGNFEKLVAHRVLGRRSRNASKKASLGVDRPKADEGESSTGRSQGKNTVRFYFEPMPFTGMRDSMSVQSIGVWGDNFFVVEAETEDEARQKLLDMLEERVWDGQVRPATEDESEEFDKSANDAKRAHEMVARWIEEDRVKGVGE
jgi:hypothetical protein